MKKILLSALLSTVIVSLVNAQAARTIIGKWKPVFVKMGTAVTMDVKADSIHISDSAKASWKKDKDPQQTEQMMMYTMEAMFRKIKNLQDEYFTDSSYTETNTLTGRSKKGTYTYNPQEKKIRRTSANGTIEDMLIAWQGNNLVVTVLMDDKKDGFEIIFERQ
jgi:hypothetical protein